MSSKKSIAHAAVPCPSRRPESESHEKPTTVYLFFHHPEGAGCHTFFSIDIPNPLPYPQTPADAKNLFEQPLSPILEFPLDEYSEKMCCLKFASKFYFIGGELFKESDPSDVFPPDVYIFDPTSTTDSSRPFAEKRCTDDHWKALSCCVCGGWFLEDDFDTYVGQMRQPHVWGGEPELLMSSHVLKMSITVYMRDRNSGSLKTIAEYGQEYGKENPICVLYHGYRHYDALRSQIGGAQSKQRKKR